MSDILERARAADDRDIHLDVLIDEMADAIRCCEDSETVIGTMTRAVLKETLRRATAEIERLRSALETIAIVEAGSAAAPSMRRIAVRALCVREALGDE